MLAVGGSRVALQPALEVKAGDQLGGIVAAEFLLLLGKELAARQVSPVNFAFQINDKNGSGIASSSALRARCSRSEGIQGECAHP